MHQLVHRTLLRLQESYFSFRPWTFNTMPVVLPIFLGRPTHLHFSFPRWWDWEEFSFKIIRKLYQARLEQVISSPSTPLIIKSYMSVILIVMTKMWSLLCSIIDQRLWRNLFKVLMSYWLPKFKMINFRVTIYILRFKIKVDILNERLF